MELDDTQRPDEGIGAKLARLNRDPTDLDAQRRRALVAASLFGEAIEAVKIGRFAILRKLGAGGMGVVYEAYDELLDRRVAIKLLRGVAETAEARARFEREAQAMARLSHPNVVTVHEVGEHEGAVFVAMEFVDGQDLRAWLDARTRSQAEVLAAFQQAGEGLAAAHAAGIVHRDFKPDNVLVGKDQRVRVADFGLAHGLSAGAEVEDESEGEGEGEPDMFGSTRTPTDSQSSRLEVELTRTGALMGTPVYMSPEQLGGQRSDARGDQFSFCAALWEGLYGQRPFSGKNFVALAQAIASGEPNPPPPEREIPAWLHAVVIRGLAPRPEDRWSSMRALLDALADDPRARRRHLIQRFAAAVGVVTLLVVAYLAAVALDHNRRQAYFNGLTESMLDIERARGLAQARDDALLARDATRMSVVRSYRSQVDVSAREDPTVAAALLREVEGPAATGAEWVSMANEVLGKPISKHVIDDHRGAITALVFSPDGMWLYSASDDGEVRRSARDTGVGETLSSHAKAVLQLVSSPDGLRLASSSEDGVVRLWSSGTGAAATIIEHERAVAALAFDAAGEQLAMGARDGAVRVFGLEGRAMASFTVPGGSAANAVHFVADDRVLLIGSKSGALYRWPIETGAPAEALEGHDEGIYFIHALADGRILTAADDGSARVWTGAGDETRSVVLTRHDAPITAVAVDGARVATAALDGTVRVSAVDRPGQATELAAHAEQVWSLAFVPGADALISTSFDKTARISPTDGRGPSRVLRGHKLELFTAAIDPSGRWLATGAYDSDVRVWDLDQARLQTPLPGHAGTVTAIAVDHSGGRALTASADGNLRIWDTATGARLDLLEPREDVTSGVGRRIEHAIFSPDGARVAVARTSGAVELWTLAERELQRLDGHSAGVWRLAFDRGGERLVSASFDASARIWALDQPAPTSQILAGHQNLVVAAAFDAGGERVFTASRDGTVRVWDAASGAAIATLTGHTGKIFTLVPSPDGRVWASGSDDGTVRLWPSDLASEALVLPGHGKDVWSIAFDDTGERLVSASHDGDARVWDARSGALIETLSGHDNVVWDAAFLPGGRVATASGDGTVRLWTLGGARPELVLGRGGSSTQLSQLAVDGRGVLIVGGEAGRALLFDTSGLSDDPVWLRERLWSATSFCPEAEQRGRELGLDLDQARASAASCRARVR